MNILFEIIGWVGSILVVGAYLQVSRRAWPPDSLRYQLMNAAGALSLMLYGWHKVAYANVIVNVVWLAVGLVAIWAILFPVRRKLAVRPKRTRTRSHR